jgi:hypothetical protein
MSFDITQCHELIVPKLSQTGAYDLTIRLRAQREPCVDARCLIGSDPQPRPVSRLRGVRLQQAPEQTLCGSSDYGRFSVVTMGARSYRLRHYLPCNDAVASRYHEPAFTRAKTRQLIGILFVRPVDRRAGATAPHDSTAGGVQHVHITRR